MVEAERLAVRIRMVFIRISLLDNMKVPYIRVTSTFHVRSVSDDLPSLTLKLINAVGKRYFGNLSVVGSIPILIIPITLDGFVAQW